MGFAAQVAELDELAAGAAAPEPAYALEVLTPKVVERVRAALAQKLKVGSTAKPFRVRLAIAVPLDLSAGGADIVEFEDAFVDREPRTLELELMFPPDYPEAAPPRVASARSASFRTGAEDEFRLLLEGYLDAFVGSPCAAAASKWRSAAGPSWSTPKPFAYMMPRFASACPASAPPCKAA